MTVPLQYEPYREDDPNRFRWRLGLRPLSLDNWLAFDEHADADLELKRNLLAQHRDTVFAVDTHLAAAAHAASEEVLDLINGWIGAYAPARIGRPGQSIDQSIDAGHDRWHPLEAAARLVQEDLALLVPTPNGLLLAAGCVCFPNEWDLRTKIGQSMMGIHRPVPRLNTELGRPIDSVLDRLRADRPMWRLGWTVVASPDLYLAVDGTATPARAWQPADYVLRVERETLRRLPRTEAVLFTIRTYRTPLGGIGADSADTLAAALDAFPADVDEYKSLTQIGDEAAAFLRSNAAAGRGQ